MALLPLLASLGGTGLNVLGAEQERKATVEGVKGSLETQRKGQRFAGDILEGSIAREQPFIEAGRGALPLAELAAVGEADFRGTPIFRGREEQGLAALMEAIQGDELSGFAGERFGSTLDASEQELNRTRLNDLLAIGLGSSGTAGQEGATLANLATQSALRGGNLQASGAQTAFEQRQNQLNQALASLGGAPSFFEATR